MNTKTKLILNLVHQFLAPKKLAIAGASRDPKKFGGTAVKDLKKRGFELFPVNPHTEEIQNKCIYMFAEPVKGPHNFHRFLVKVFGRYPKKVSEV